MEAAQHNLKGLEGDVNEILNFYVGLPNMISAGTAVLETNSFQLTKELGAKYSYT